MTTIAPLPAGPVCARCGHAADEPTGALGTWTCLCGLLLLHRL